MLTVRQYHRISGMLNRLTSACAAYHKAIATNEPSIKVCKKQDEYREAYQAVDEYLKDMTASPE